MNRFVTAVRRSVAEKNWLSALAMALTLPDICARIEGINAENDRGRYVIWFDKYLLGINTVVGPAGTKIVFLSGKDCYALRCAYLHEGSDISAGQKVREALSKFHFRAPGGLVMHRNLFPNTGVLQLRVDMFCEEVCSAVEKWQAELVITPEIQSRLDGLLTVYEGTAGYEEIGGVVQTMEEADREIEARERKYRLMFPDSSASK